MSACACVCVSVCGVFVCSRLRKVNDGRRERGRRKEAATEGADAGNEKPAGVK